MLTEPKYVGRCLACGEEWPADEDPADAGRCPACGSSDITSYPGYVEDPIGDAMQAAASIPRGPGRVRRFR